MTQFSKMILGAALIAASFAAGSAQADNYSGEERTVGRSVSGSVTHPAWLMNVPEHYEFLPYTSNHEPQNQHSAQWKGQEWDPSMWNANWTPDVAIRKFYENGVFEKQYMNRRNKGTMPVLVVGPTFYKLSELDQYRSVKLLADNEKIFENGYAAVTLQDWYTNQIIGSLTKEGLQLR